MIEEFGFLIGHLHAGHVLEMFLEFISFLCSKIGLERWNMMGELNGLTGRVHGLPGIVQNHGSGTIRDRDLDTDLVQAGSNLGLERGRRK